MTLVSPTISRRRSPFDSRCAHTCGAVRRLCSCASQKLRNSPITRSGSSTNKRRSARSDRPYQRVERKLHDIYLLEQGPRVLLVHNTPCIRYQS